jgi:hypothetical protein
MTRSTQSALSAEDQERLRLYADGIARRCAEQIGRPFLASFPRESDETLLDHVEFWRRVARAMS